MSIDPITAVSDVEGSSTSQQVTHSAVQGLQECKSFIRTPEQEARLLKLAAMMSEIRDELFKLLQEVKKHPKNLALWLEIANLKAQHKILNKEFGQEQQDPTRVMPKSVEDSLNLLDAAVKPAIASAQSLQKQDLTNIHLKEANAIRPADSNNASNTSDASASEEVVQNTTTSHSL